MAKKKVNPEEEMKVEEVTMTETIGEGETVFEPAVVFAPSLRSVMINSRDDLEDLFKTANNVVRIVPVTEKDAPVVLNNVAKNAGIDIKNCEIPMCTVMTDKYKKFELSGVNIIDVYTVMRMEDDDEPVDMNVFGVCLATIAALLEKTIMTNAMEKNIIYMDNTHFPEFMENRLYPSLSAAVYNALHPLFSQTINRTTSVILGVKPVELEMSMDAEKKKDKKKYKKKDKNKKKKKKDKKK